MPGQNIARYQYFPTATSELRFIGITGTVIGICLAITEYISVQHQSAFASQYLGFWMGCFPAVCNGVLVLLGVQAKQVAMTYTSAIRCFETGVLATLLHIVLAGSSFASVNEDIATNASKMALAGSLTKFWLALFAFTFSMHQIVVLWRVKRFFADSEKQRSK